MASLSETTQSAQNTEQQPDDYDFVFGSSQTGDPDVDSGWTYKGGAAPDNWATTPYTSASTTPAGSAEAPRHTDTWTTSKVWGAGTTYGKAGSAFGSAYDDLVNMARGGKTRTGDIDYSGSIKPTGGAGVGGAGGGLKPYATVTSRSTVFPKGSQWPTFAGPTWDEQAIRSKARKLTAPITAQMGQAVQQAMSKYYENPNVRKMVLRDTLQGYGIGLGRAIAQGEAAARQEYTADYGRQYNEAMNAYNMAIQKMTSQAQQIQTSQSVYSAKELEQLTGITQPTSSNMGDTSKRWNRIGSIYY